MPKRFIKLLDYFFVLRPTLFYPVWTVSLAGYWAFLRFGSDRNAVNIAPSRTTDFTYIVAIGLFTLLMGASFLINQIEDAETDRLNNKLFIIANGHMTEKQAYLETFLLAGLPILIFLWSRADIAIVMFLAFFITGWCYSCQPFILKNKPYGGLFANILGYYLVFAFGWMIKGTASMQMLIHATPYALGIVAIYFFTTIPDMEGDRSAGKTTLAVKYGMRPIILAGMATDVAAIISSVLAKDWVILAPTLLILPFFIYTTIKNSVQEVLRTNKYGTLFLSLIICVRFPIYLVLITVLFFFSRWYYRQRFNIIYPSFRS